ncbi:helix-turn-helix domain-containing protein [Streptomyces sp. NBC_00525]|uniref:helix-turn-helix domain-containing protein n=1 Tax=Streptomyces sp. NBC_00525 TaxID=2903660 RepID=UPI002E805410|nr:helix-turn-helix domain-containing protein [Streptomyces sp. NBC_00525]WUC92120.1 helix-turn-helix domain-containing protein [Streptomyces sp. NBC_00525]WUC97525.1 helix-turn-helix domain-containing protein [Streptomyces sp. NBC_00525]
MLLTTGQAAAELGMAITTFRRLVHAHLIPGLTNRGVRVIVPLEAVQALSTRHAAPLHALEAPEIAVLRVEADRRAREGNAGNTERTGFSATLQAGKIQEAMRGWWRCDAASVAAGQVLPVTVSGYVVAVLTGLGRWESNGQGRHAFPDAVLAGYVTDLVQPVVHLTAPSAADRRTAELLLGSRLPSHSGGPIAYVSTRNIDCEAP